MQPGDTVLGMNLAQGGHLKSRLPVNFSRQTVQHSSLRV
ncbi:hypothetical protein ACNKHO_16130 [Shigella flexneri]